MRYLLREKTGFNCFSDCYMMRNGRQVPCVFRDLGEAREYARSLSKLGDIRIFTFNGPANLIEVK